MHTLTQLGTPLLSYPLGQPLSHPITRSAVATHTY